MPEIHPIIRKGGIIQRTEILYILTGDKFHRLTAQPGQNSYLPNDQQDINQQSQNNP